MRSFLLAACLSLAAVPALAQANPPPPNPEPPPTARPPGPPRGAEIRIRRPDIAIAVRCAEGETTRACGEIVAQMIEKLAAMPIPERGAEGQGQGRERGGYGRGGEGRGGEGRGGRGGYGRDGQDGGPQRYRDWD